MATIAFVVADIVAGLVVLSSWVGYVNPILSAIATILAIVYYWRRLKR